ncbi:right-handed parallel beta-helix repeat-containing protein [Paenibacillus sp. SYP-B4298]|uniref:right-handed parallel beta-helix repeat-containing protein n=1 Tax=Paenibacillus sp. SYP-B4298 TaxID=2996034 RepID=UPI0022DD2B17|nr:right-handed parallel beta-helix repeat-containing protein [Paenibacillus sp. SYP-B4298]
MRTKRLEKLLVAVLTSALLLTMLSGAMGSGVAYAAQTTYYVDAQDGNDQWSGTTASRPWKSLDKVNATTFQAGDRILLKKNRTWFGQLHPKGSGASGNPITIGSYGIGNRPVINGGSLTSGAAVYLLNQQYWVIENLEVINNSGSDNAGTATTAGVARYGILVEANGAGTKLNDIRIQNNYVHEVNGCFNCAPLLDAHINGGITVRATGSNDSFNGVLIENNRVENVGRDGITFWQDRYFAWDQLVVDVARLSTGVVIRNNNIADTDGESILVFGANGALIERNVGKAAGSRFIPGGDMNASVSMFPTRSANTVMQYNEAYLTQFNDTDGQGFDIDLGHDNGLVQYNYSHHNEGGFLLLIDVESSAYPATVTNTTIRYNISENDGPVKGLITFALALPNNTHIYNNTFYNDHPTIRPIYCDDYCQTNPKKAGKVWSFKNNIVYTTGSAEYVLPSTTGQIDYNLYYGGHHASEPNDVHKLTSDPLFVQPGSGGIGLHTVSGYKLREGSPALGSGVVIANNGGKDYYGNPVSATAAPHRGFYNGAAISNAAATAILDAKAAIEALPSAQALQLTDAGAVEAARALVAAALTAGATADDVINLAKLTELEQRLSRLLDPLLAKIDAAIAAIDQLPAASELVYGDKTAVQAARALVDAAIADGASPSAIINTQHLADNEAQIALLEADYLVVAAAIQSAIDAIDALPPLPALALTDKSSVEAARALVDAAKSQGAPESSVLNIGTLNAAEARILELRIASRVTWTDTFNNLNLSYMKSSGWVLDSTNTSTYFEGDSFRLSRSNSSTQSMIYEATAGHHIAGFRVKSYYFINPGTVMVYGTATDPGLSSTVWTPIAYTSADPVVTSGQWRRTYLTNSAELPEGLRYIKFEITGSPSYSPQIGTLELSMEPTL